MLKLKEYGTLNMSLWRIFSWLTSLYGNTFYIAGSLSVIVCIHKWPAMRGFDIVFVNTGSDIGM